MKIHHLVCSMMLVSTQVMAGNAPDLAPSQEFVRPLIEFLAPARGLAGVDGSGEIAIALRYGDNIDPASFHAEIGGVDVTRFFNPRPGKVEVVKLSAELGSHRLIVTADTVTKTIAAATADEAETYVQPVIVSSLRPVLGVEQVNGNGPPDVSLHREEATKKTKK